MRISDWSSDVCSSDLLNGKTPEDCFSRVVNSNHEGNAMAVASGKIDVATNNTESIYARLAEANPEAAASIKEIWRSPLIPSDPMVWRKALPEDAKQKIYYFRSEEHTSELQ